jgi:hypothetical protein
MNHSGTSATEAEHPFCAEQRRSLGGAPFIGAEPGRWAVQGRSERPVVAPSMDAISGGDVVRGRGNGGRGGEAMS